MNAYQMERAAYIAAHRLLTTDLNATELACPGARRSAVLDKMAKIITSVYEAHNELFDEATDWWPSETDERSSRLSLHVAPKPADRRRGSATQQIG
jgi:hypothetical protein